MEPTPRNEGLDPVRASVAAYSEHVAAYSAAHAEKMAEVILDAGCGAGRDLERFVRGGHCAVGVDLNEAFLAVAADTLEGWPVQLHQADLRDLPFDDGAFDTVWACASLVHLTPDAAEQALGELARVTRAGGPLYVSVKGAGASGWRHTPHGLRYFTVWGQRPLHAALGRAGWGVEALGADGDFVTAWARRLPPRSAVSGRGGLSRHRY